MYLTCSDPSKYYLRITVTVKRALYQAARKKCAVPVQHWISAVALALENRFDASYTEGVVVCVACKMTAPIPQILIGLVT